MVFMEESAWDAVVNVSLKGMFNVTRSVLQHMVRNRSGKIINIASLSGLKGVPGQTNYSAAKGGMIASTRSLAQEIAKRNITVNAVAPGFISSDMTKGLDEDKFKKLVPMNRFGQPQEVADLVSFLASEKANYITGEVININGGIY
jgi:3-oxoacyl-[acyl-carrier protein] reductase